MKTKTTKAFEQIKAIVFELYKVQATELVHESESAEYGAATFKIGSKKALFRISKITPTKIGQFVTIWKRNAQGVTEPYSDKDSVDFLFVYAMKDSHSGLFIFPKEALLKYNIFTHKSVDGKRGFRLYPAWDIPTSKQALKTQLWQLNYFHTIS